MALRVIETFSGIGAQAKALNRLSHRIDDFEYEIVATCEWEIGAMYAYDLIHHGPQNLDLYAHLSKEELLAKLLPLNLSNDGKTPLSDSTLQKMPVTQLQAILHAINTNQNKVDISEVHAWDLPYADMLTYSFPCQDLSISSFWWNNTSGIDPNSGNRSSLLWQIGRLLNEYDQANLPKPRFLLMENVTAIQSPMHEENFNSWLELLNQHNYTVNEPIQLNARNFGVPQNRVRTYMLSVLASDYDDAIRRDLIEHTLRGRRLAPTMDGFLRLDYSDPQYFEEAIESTPNYTDSRRRIHDRSVILAEGNELTGNIAKTITTKQDRFPTAGLIEHHLDIPDREIPAPYRNLTPREAFLLMGFDEIDFQTIKDENLRITNNRNFLSHSKLLKLAGNSIVVNVLEAIFEQVNNFNNQYFDNNRADQQLDNNIIDLRHRRII
ncbi:DNA (cytosine-5-)-methyltransferase [uncultured Enterococcus sp.]|uniref:DNA (cytosine-5-)-methyltransferase n=1 Tax=uncultured Enterococcus sp. TaxID=167972 RepID=UPI002AA7996B|nr:DNA (cytosine-5-)-methyltransferase [uncultured Enterococcus sp.]